MFDYHEVALTLCAGRHETPAQECIFQSINPSMSFREMEREAMEVISTYMPRVGDEENWYTVNTACLMQYPCIDGISYAKFRNIRLVIYVTGYTPALIAALNAAERLAIAEVVLMHYDRDSMRYRPQLVRTGVVTGGDDGEMRQGKSHGNLTTKPSYGILSVR